MESNFMPLIPRLWNLVINQMKTLDIVAVWWLCINPFAPFCLVIFVSSGVGKLRRLHSLLLLHMGSCRGPCTDLALSPLCQVPSVSHKNYLLVFCFSSQPATLDQLLSFQPFCLLGRSGETLAIKPSRRPWALGVCLLPAYSIPYWKKLPETTSIVSDKDSGADLGAFTGPKCNK